MFDFFIKLFILHRLVIQNLFFFNLTHFLHFLLSVYLLIHRSRSEVVHYHPIDFHGWARGLQLQLHIELRLVLHLRNGLKSQPTLRVSIEFQY
jgi:hypothetical protein